MHQQGRMSEETIRFIVGSVSVSLKSKFSVDENGLWYNERLEEETRKRAEFTESRRSNGLKGGRPKANGKPTNNHMRNHMVNHMEDENENENDNDIGGKVLKKKEEEKTENPIPEKKHSSVFTDFDTRSPELKEIEYPFNTESFRAAWNDWKEFKRREFSFKYKSPQSENAALANLKQLSGNEQIAIAIMAQSKANGWKGFFELKKQVNETIKHSPGRTIIMDKP